MSANIRIIKRSERDAKSRAANSRAAEIKSARHTTRDISGQVTSWIKELQQRHTPDPRRAFASLFVDPATSAAE